jgi:hypothetical protein
MCPVSLTRRPLSPDAHPAAITYTPRPVGSPLGLFPLLYPTAPPSSFRLHSFLFFAPGSARPRSLLPLDVSIMCYFMSALDSAATHACPLSGWCELKMELCRRRTVTMAVCNPCRETLKSRTKEVLHCTHLFMTLCPTSTPMRPIGGVHTSPASLKNTSNPKLHKSTSTRARRALRRTSSEKE